MILEPGSDLGTLVGVSPAGLPPAQVGQIATAVAAALDYLHGQGRVHGDVRPSTIVVGPQGQMVLSDGVAPLDPTYAAPERLQGGPVDGRADQYSLACTVFRLLTGRDPFAGANREAVATAHLGQPVPSVRAVHPYLSPEVDVVIGHAVAKDPRYRYVSCGEFAKALSASLASPSLGPPVAPAYPPRPPRRQAWWVAAALTAAVAIVAAVVVFVANGDRGGSNQAGSGNVMAWDDTLYPQEIPSVFRSLARDELLRSVSARPEPAWTTPIGDGRPDVVGGDDTIVLLRVDTHLIGLRADTGAPSWPAVDLHDAVMSCAVHENRIGCVASASNGSDSSVFVLDAGSGHLLKTVKVPNQDLGWIVAAGDRFVVTTDSAGSDDKGFAAGYTTEGDEVWTHEGRYVVASQRILVDGTPSGDEVSFVSTEDGREVLRSTRARDGRDLTWNVFHGGIAVQNEDWTGTDIYDVDGKKKSSVAGWEPVAYQSVYTTASPLPLLARLEETNYQDDHTIAAANPETGHLLWRISGPELTHEIATADDKLMVKVNDPDASTSTTGPTGREVVRVYDCYSGEPVSPPIDMTGSVSVEVYWIKTDGSRLVYNYIDSDGGYTEAAYLMATGEKSWEVPLAGHSGYPGGAIVAATGEGSVSLFR